MSYGKRIRFGRLLGEGKRPVIVAVDHGAEFGPTPGLLDFDKALARLGEADAILINPGMIESQTDFFGRPGAPAMIARVTWTTAYCIPWSYRESHTSYMMRAEDALAAGAEFIMGCCLLQSGSEEVDRDNVRTFTEIVRDKERAGVPLIGELFPVDAENISEEELHARIYYGVRILAELGADAIKTFHTGAWFSEIVKAAPVPVLALGASKKEESMALDLARTAIAQGAQGVIFGRNVFQADDPAAFLKALKTAVN